MMRECDFIGANLILCYVSGYTHALWMLSAQLAEFRDSSGCLDRRLADRDPRSVCLGGGLGWAGCRLWQTLTAAIEIVRRGGTVSLSGVYGGMADPLPMMSLFDKQIQLRMGQSYVKRWMADFMPFLTEDDPLGVDEFATHRLPLAEPRRRTACSSAGRRRGQEPAQAVVMIQP